MEKRFLLLPPAIFVVILFILHIAIPSLFAVNASHVFLIVISILLSLVSSFPVLLPKMLKGTSSNDKTFRKALIIFGAIYIVISLLLVVGIPSDSLRIDVGYLVLFMISFLYALNLYLTMMWLHRLPWKKQNPKPTSDLRREIVRLLEALAARADGLSDEYSQEKERILSLPEKARAIKEAEAIEAAVMEQNIMSSISAFTSVYENALSGAAPDAKKFNQALESLESIIQMRSKQP